MKTYNLRRGHVVIIAILAVSALILSYLLIKSKRNNEKQDFTKTDAAISDSVRVLSDSTLWGIIGTDFADEAAKLDSNGQR